MTPLLGCFYKALGSDPTLSLLPGNGKDLDQQNFPCFRLDSATDLPLFGVPPAQHIPVQSITFLALSAFFSCFQRILY